MATTQQTIELGGLRFAYDSRVLRPRAWTVAQSQWAADLMASAPPGPLLELFAGVGHIGLLAVAGSDRDLVMVDLNPAAVAFARRNAADAGLGSRATVREGRVDEVLLPGETFGLIVADPPWVPSSGIDQFPDDPSIAIDGGEDGLALARTCCGVIDRHLAPNGSALLQLGSVDQAATLAAYVADDLGSALRVVDVRAYERGVLVRLAR